jgi:glycosyltransferase involved in cell wall biosynthesis
VSRFSFIIPFHRDLVSLERCLRALDPVPDGGEVIIAADGAIDDCREIAATHGARVIAVDGPRGPAVARNAAAAAATGDVLVFVDADVMVSRSGLARMMRLFETGSENAAVFGAYDEEPDHPAFMSQYKNLSHSFIHQASAARARTFWAGFGAVRRHAFRSVGGFDERFARPSVEDIDLGYRLTAAGYQVLLDPTLSARHLKRWTLRSAVVSDVRDRGIPWTQLILRYGAIANDLNLRWEYRWSVVFAYLATTSLALALADSRFLWSAAAALALVSVLNRRYYEFFYRKRGAWFAARVWPVHLLHHLANGVSFGIGAALFVASRYLRLQLPGTLPSDSWTAVA